MTRRRLYELAGTDPVRRFSPFCWRARMALAHKGLEAESVIWRFTESGTIAFSGQDKVPVLVDGEKVVSDSWSIARYLEGAYPDRPALFPAGLGAERFLASWADTVLNPALLRLIVSDIPALLGEGEASYFRQSREARLGMTLEQVTAQREAALPGFRKTLRPLRDALAEAPYLGGACPAYGDYAVFGSFQWARVVSPLVLLETGDAVWAWMERMLDLHGGLGRTAPARNAAA